MMVSEVLRQMLQEVSAAEIKLEHERIAEEKRKLEEARLVCQQLVYNRRITALGSVRKRGKYLLF